MSGIRGMRDIYANLQFSQMINPHAHEVRVCPLCKDPKERKLFRHYFRDGLPRYVCFMQGRCRDVCLIDNKQRAYSSSIALNSYIAVELAQWLEENKGK